MGWIGWIILGGLAGWIADLIMKEKGGILKNILLGIVGAVIGGGIVQFFGGAGVTGFNLYSLLIAVVGAIVLIWAVRLASGSTSAH